MPCPLRHRAFLLPVCAATALTACGSDKAAAPVPLDPAPEIVRFEALASPLAPGDIIQFYVRFRDTVHVTRVILHIKNAFVVDDTFDFNPPQSMVAAIVPVVVPVHAVSGVPADAKLIITDSAGRVTSALGAALIRDFRPPWARLTLRGLRADQTIGTGDTLEAHIYASDNQLVSYIGYEVDGVRDSVAASGLGDSHDFLIAVRPSWRAARPVFRAWARDKAGNVSTASSDNVRELPVYDWSERTAQTAPVAGYPYPAEMLWDTKRDAAYILRFDGGGTGERSDIVRVTSGGAETLVSLPQQALAFTFSGTGDSLIVPIPALNVLGIVDLRQPVPSLTLLPLQHQLGSHWWPLGAQVSGKHLFVSLVANFDQTRLLDIDLATGTQVIRSDLDGGPEAPPRSSLLRLADGRLLICAESPSAYFQLRFLYSPTSNSFTPTARLRAATPWQFSASPSGRFMLGDAVFDAALDSVAVVTSRDWYPGVQRSAALSADGTAAYLATWYGYEKRRLSDGALLEQVKLGAGSNFLVAAPDGNKLIVLGALPGTTSGEFALRIVDLR